MGVQPSPRISGNCQQLNRPYPGSWVLSTVDPPRPMAESPGLVFTQRRSVVDMDVPQGGGLGSGRKPVGAEPL
ncbi:hypothetical protein BHM03_00058338 [Ensete ventricosum]|nr:hypothetical protein BHM03_00058338 [Ensete ventricosum]